MEGGYLLQEREALRVHQWMHDGLQPLHVGLLVPHTMQRGLGLNHAVHERPHCEHTMPQQGLQALLEEALSPG